MLIHARPLGLKWGKRKRFCSFVPLGMQ